MSARGKVELQNFDLTTRLAKCARLIEKGDFQAAFDESSDSPLWAVISGWNDDELDSFLFRRSGYNGKQLQLL
jgi:hypothetical protein